MWGSIEVGVSHRGDLASWQEYAVASVSLALARADCTASEYRGAGSACGRISNPAYDRNCSISQSRAYLLASLAKLIVTCGGELGSPPALSGYRPNAQHQPGRPIERGESI